MNEGAVRRTLKTLLNNNKTTLVSGLTAQGQPRLFNQITTSTLTPPRFYYFASISVERVETELRPGFEKTASTGPSQAIYDIAIELSDYAISSSGEDQLYEKMDSDFQLFGDRVVSLLRSSYWMEDSTTNLKFRLFERKTVSKSNLSSIWTDAESYHALLYCRITFQLIEECTDDTVLY